MPNNSLFVCKYKISKDAASQAEELDIQRVFPIYGHFATVMSQMRRGNMDGQHGSSAKSVLNQPRSGEDCGVGSTFFG